MSQEIAEKTIRKLHLYINERLQETEKCKFVIEIVSVDSNPRTAKDDKEVLFLGFVSNTESEYESAVILLDRHETRIRVKHFLPLTKEFRFTILSGGELEVFLPNKKYNFLISDSESYFKFLTELALVCEKLANVRIATFLWMKNYTTKKWDDFLIIEDKEPNLNKFETLGTRSLGPREDWVKQKLKERSDEFTKENKLRVIIGTWNVNMKYPKNPAELGRWLSFDQDGDIYAIGLQEVDMSANAMIKEETDAFTKWNTVFSEAFRTAPSQYQMLSSKQLVGLYVVVFAKSDHLEYISELKVMSLACGALGMMGNKGAVAVRFQFHETTCCFVNCHLAHQKKAFEKRNQNQLALEKGLSFDSDPRFYNCSVHDLLFWFGDTNYRVNLKYEEVKEHLKRGNIEQLLKFDQLCDQKRKKRTFVGFEESRITFPCTYKFDPGTSTYDTSEKRRVPSFTDRIQWKCSNTSVSPLVYTAHSDYLMSDHKPVVGIYEVGIRVIVQDRFQRVHQEVIRLLDKAENETRPEVNIEPKVLNFNKVSFGVERDNHVVIKNVGTVLCEFSFVKKATNKVSKPFLTVSPERGIVLPNEKLEIKFTIMVDTNSSVEANRSKKLEDICIMRLKNGGDHFVSVTAEYLPSCFGSSLHELVGQHRGVRETSSIGNEDENQMKLSIPKEIWMMTSWLYQNAMKTPMLFMEGGEEKEVERIREMLDTGKSLDDYHGSTHSMAAAFIHLLQTLAEPVIPTKFYQLSIIMGYSNEKIEKVYEDFLFRLDSVHFNVLQYIFAFLRELLKTKYIENGLTSNKLAVLFSTVLMRVPTITDKETGVTKSLAQTGKHSDQGKINFLKMFLDFQQEWNDPKHSLFLKDNK